MTLPALPLSKTRLDKWLWCARFLKTRNAATVFCTETRIRINGHAVQKGGAFVQVGDVLTFAWHDQIRVLEIIAVALRRGPAPEAIKLYKELPTNPVSPSFKDDC